MKVMVTGPESSGSGATAALVRSMGHETVHRAVPHVDDWEPDLLRFHCDVWVITHREPLALYRSQVKRGQAADETAAMWRIGMAYRYIWDQAAFAIVTTHSVTYESLWTTGGVAALAALLDSTAEALEPLECWHNSPYYAELVSPPLPAPPPRRGSRWSRRAVC